MRGTKGGAKSKVEPRSGAVRGTRGGSKKGCYEGNQGRSQEESQEGVP